MVNVLLQGKFIISAFRGTDHRKQKANKRDKSNADVVQFV
jgi:hypothetical protein